MLKAILIVALLAVTACSVVPRELSKHDKLLLQAATGSEAAPSLKEFVQRRTLFSQSKLSLEDLLAEARKDQDPFVRDWGVWGLSCEEAETIKGFLKDPAPEVRIAAFYSLQRCPLVSDALWDQYGAVLLRDPASSVRMAAYLSCPERVITQCVQQSFDESESSVRKAFYGKLPADLFDDAAIKKAQEPQESMRKVIAGAVQDSANSMAVAEVLQRYAGHEALVPLIEKALRRGGLKPGEESLLYAALLGTSHEAKAKKWQDSNWTSDDEQIRFNTWDAHTVGKVCTGRSLTHTYGTDPVSGAILGWKVYNPSTKEPALPFADGMRDPSMRVRVLIVQRCGVDVPLSALLDALATAPDSLRTDILRVLAVQAEVRKLSESEEKRLYEAALYYRDNFSDEVGLAAVNLLKIMEGVESAPHGGNIEASAGVSVQKKLVALSESRDDWVRLQTYLDLVDSRDATYLPIFLRGLHDSYDQVRVASIDGILLLNDEKLVRAQIPYILALCDDLSFDVREDLRQLIERPQPLVDSEEGKECLKKLQLDRPEF